MPRVRRAPTRPRLPQAKLGSRILKPAGGISDVPVTLTDQGSAADTLQIPIPQQVANCHLWLRPEGIAALTNGAGIATWPDESGFANDPVQATGTAQPTKADNAINNLPAALFDPAASQRLRSTTADVLTAFNNVPGATMFAVCAPNLEDSTDRQVIYWSTNNVGSRRAGLVKANPSPGNMAVGGRRLDADPGLAIPGTTATTSGVWAAHCGVLDYASATASIYRNSILEAGPTTFQTAGNTSATNSVAVGIGSSSAVVGGGFWPGHIAEIIVYNRVLTAPERDLVTNYLLAKYNLTVETPKTLADSGTGSDRLQVLAAASVVDSGQAADSLTVDQGVTPKTLADSGAATDRLCHDGGPTGAPDCLLVETNLTGPLPYLWDDPQAADANWLTAVDPTLVTDLRVSFPTPAIAPGSGGPTEFQTLLRKPGAGSDLTVAVELWEAGIFRKELVVAAVTSTTGQVIAATLNPADLTVADGSQVELRVRSLGQPPDGYTDGYQPEY